MIAMSRLAALSFGDLPEDEEKDVLEHVLACDACTQVLARIGVLGRELRALIATGQANLSVPPKLLHALEQQSLITRHYKLNPGETVACSVGADDVYVATTLSTPELSGRIDLIVGAERLVDVAFDPRAHTLTFINPGELLRRLPSVYLPVRLVRVASEREEVIADYALNHSGFAV